MRRNMERGDANAARRNAHAEKLSSYFAGWPLEWVSGIGATEEDPNAFVLVHCAGPIGLAVQCAKTSFILTARDRKNRMWSTAFTFEDPLLAKRLGHLLVCKLESTIAEIGQTRLPRPDAGGTIALPSHFGSTVIRQRQSIKQSANVTAL